MKQYAAKIRELDALVQKWACRQRSYISGYPAQCGHHYIGRSEMLLRWDLRNIIPLTFDEHRLVHDGMLRFEIQILFANSFCLIRKTRG